LVIAAVMRLILILGLSRSRTLSLFISSDLMG
jgi:hypothetical protein